MPQHVVNKITQNLEFYDKKLNIAKIVLLGLSYRGNVKEYRYSPTLEIIDILNNIEVDVYLHDPLFTNSEVREITSVNFTNDLQKALVHADCIVLLADHKEYDESLVSKMDLLANKPYIFIDTRNKFDIEETTERKIDYLGK